LLNIIIMTNKTINSPRELVNHLINIFPAFVQEWDEGEGFGVKGHYTYHVVFLTFGSESRTLLNKATTNQIEEFCALINYAVKKGGELENAVSTCFLEHATQLGVLNMIKRCLSVKAKGELH